MARLRIRHETLYTYERPVRFAPHRLLIRPRDSHATRILYSSLTLSPPGETRWVYDALGNCVCWYAPEGDADRLSIVSELHIARYPAPLAPLDVRDPQTAMPIVYDAADRMILSPFLAPVTEDESGALLRWLRAQIGPSDETALDFLLRLNSTIHQSFEYRVRDGGAAQDPEDTVILGCGTCRDFAWLMVEALRRLGYATRFVTGYLHSPRLAAMRGAGATHAWVEVFLPDLGWTHFDPTNGLAESPDLIAVAATRTPAEAAPVSGAIFGDAGQSRLEVHVDVQPDEEMASAA